MRVKKRFDENESTKVKYVYYQDSMNYLPLVNHPHLYVIDKLGDREFMYDQMERISIRKKKTPTVRFVHKVIEIK